MPHRKWTVVTVWTVIGLLVLSGMVLLLGRFFSPTTYVQLWVSSEDGRYHFTRFGDIKAKSIKTTPVAGSQVDYVLYIDPAITYQTILGFGSSLEHSSCYNLYRLDPSTRERVMKRVFDPKTGIGMNLMRISIGTPDFTPENWYTYDDMPEGETDLNLEHFTIEKDKRYIIPILKEALKINPDLKIFASPWSPPAWMKDSHQICGGHILEEYFEVYAKYFAKFIKAYEAEGIPIYAVTVQNEPGFEWIYPSCTWTWEEERDFVKNYLGPEFERENISTKIWIFDWNFAFWDWPSTILDDENAARYIDGVAFHRYAGLPVAMTYLHQRHPNKHVYFTEGYTLGTSGALQIIEYLRNWARSYNDWVLILDENAGPNRGPCRGVPSPLMLKTDLTVDYKFEYYMYGHFSKFIPRGSVRIYSTPGDNSFSNVAFRTPEGDIVIVVANASDQSICFKMVYGASAITATIDPSSVMTLKWRNVD
jgi:glucosylceramidase